MKRRLDRTDALAITLGAVIGAGVFRDTGLVLRGTGGFAARRVRTPKRNALLAVWITSHRRRRLLPDL